MNTTINNLHVITKGLILSIVLHMIAVGFIVVTGFNPSILIFTILLLIVMFISGFYVGTISERYAIINGIILSIITSIFFLLYLSQYTEMNWEVNRIFIASYLVMGFLSSLLSRLTSKKDITTTDEVKNFNQLKKKNKDSIKANKQKKEKRDFRKEKEKLAQEFQNKRNLNE